MRTPTSGSASVLRGAIARVSVLGFLLLPACAIGAKADGDSLPDAVSQPALPEPDESNLQAFVELVRSDIGNEKAILIAQNIDFTEDEAAEFWPLHREYDQELNKLLDERLTMIRRFLLRPDSMTEDQAGDLAKAAFDLEARRTTLKRATFAKFSAVIPAVKAARFFQIENQLNAALDLRLAAALPLIK